VSEGNFGYGWQEPADSNSEFNATCFLVRQLIAKISTMTPVKVQAVTNSGGLSPAGTVDVLPLVSMIDGAGHATKHGTLHGLPYFRLQGGANAVIIDPEVGDIGFAVFADRDISAVVANKGAANPGSRRRFDMADGIYCGGVLNGTSTQYVQFTSTGIKIADKNANVIEMKSDGIHFTGKVFMSADLAVVGAITAASAALTGALSAASATLTGALAAASAALSGALTAASAAITGALSGGTVTASTAVTAGTTVTAGTDVIATGLLRGGDMQVTGHVAYTLHTHPVSGVQLGGGSVGSGSPT
jgi:hypothetical protein